MDYYKMNTQEDTRSKVYVLQHVIENNPGIFNEKIRMAAMNLLDEIQKMPTSR